MKRNVHGTIIFTNYTSDSTDVHKPMLYLKKGTSKRKLKTPWRKQKYAKVTVASSR